MSKIKRIHNRINRIEDRFRKKVAKGKKGTDMDIELHERRIRKLIDKIPAVERYKDWQEKIGFTMPHGSPLDFASFVRGVDNRKGEEKIVPNIGNSEKVYNMTPGVSEDEARKVRDKFDKTYMKRGSHAHADSEFEKATYQLMNEGVIEDTSNKNYPTILRRMEENKRDK